MNIKVLSLVLAVITLSGVAIADTVTTPPPSSTAATKSTYDWTGVYVGGFVGGASGANGTSSNSSGQNNNGVTDPLYSANSSSNYSTSSSFIGGGTVGYNWQIGKTPYLVGLEGEYGYLGMSGSSQGQSILSTGYGDVITSSTNNKTTIGSDYGYGLIGGRLGYALNRSLFYIKSGAVFTQVKSTNSTNTSIAVPGIIPNTQLNDNPNPSNSGGTTTGYAIGGGVEYAPSYFGNQNFSIKAEYLYFGIEQANNAINYNQNNCDVCNPDYVTTADYHNSTGGIHTAKIGVNYKF